MAKERRDATVANRRARASENESRTRKEVFLGYHWWATLVAFSWKGGGGGKPGDPLSLRHLFCSAKPKIMTDSGDCEVTILLIFGKLMRRAPAKMPLAFSSLGWTLRSAAVRGQRARQKRKAESLSER